MGAPDGLPEKVLEVPVRRGRVSTDIHAGHHLAPHLVASTSEVVLIEEDRRILVRGTEEIVVDAPASEDAAVAHHLYGFVARCVLLHRGTFSLHASLVEVSGAVVGIAGASGAGKSTTATAMAKRGARLLIDDVLPVVVDGHRLIATPFERPVHLTSDAASGLGLGSADAAVVPGSGKLVLDLARPAGPVSLGGLIRLQTEPGERHGEVLTRALRGGERLREVVRLSNATGLASLGDRGPSYFAWCSHLADQLPLLTVTRPEHGDTLTQVMGMIEDFAAGVVDAPARADTPAGSVPSHDHTKQ